MNLVAEYLDIRERKRQESIIDYGVCEEIIFNPNRMNRLHRRAKEGTIQIVGKRPFMPKSDFIEVHDEEKNGSYFYLNEEIHKDIIKKGYPLMVYYKGYEIKGVKNPWS